jgi:uncharacterized DUF497 family protein
MDFEWDEAKSALNLARRGFGFDFAARIFEGPVTEYADDRRDYGEPRMIALGCVDGEWLVVVYTWRGEMCRIISARKASRKERPP